MKIFFEYVVNAIKYVYHLFVDEPEQEDDTDEDETQQ